MAPFFKQYLLMSCLSYFGNSYNISVCNYFIMVICDQWVIFDVTALIDSAWHELYPRFTAKFIDEYMHSDCFTNWPFPISLPLLRPCYSLRHKNIVIRPNNYYTMASACSSERKSHASVTSNQKLELIKLSEEASRKPK